jgi:hypothetical protein
VARQAGTAALASVPAAKIAAAVATRVFLVMFCSFAETAGKTPGRASSATMAVDAAKVKSGLGDSP